MSDPLVSIALCTYNGERFLRQQLDSLVNQSYRNLEIVAVDDKSTDDTLSILNEYQEKFKFLKIFQNNTNVGFRRNFEIALLKCSGEFIALCDQDDVWNHNKIKIQMENIADNTLVYHDSSLTDSNGKKLNKNISDLMHVYSGNQCHYFLLGNCISGHSCLFSRSIFNDLLPLPEKLYHDRWLGFIATLSGNITFLDQSLVDYRQHSGSSTDIMKLKKPGKEADLFNRQKLIAEIEIFKHAAPGDPFINTFYRLLNESLDRYICTELFFFVYRNKHVLMYFKKKSQLSVLNHCLKFLWGFKIKKAFSIASRMS